MVGVNDAGLGVSGTDASGVPTADTIKGILHAYINATTTAVAKASEARLITRNYKVTGPVKSTKGDISVVQSYIPTATGTAATFKGTLDPLEAAMKSMVTIAQENNQLFENEKAKYDVALKASRDELTAEKTRYAADVSTKQRAAEGTQADLKKARADTGALVRIVLRDGVVLAGFGILFGIIGALAVGRVLSSLLYGVSAFDVPTYAVIVVAILALTVLAGLQPARRAASVDPVVALRYE